MNGIQKVVGSNPICSMERNLEDKSLFFQVFIFLSFRSSKLSIENEIDYV